MKSTRYKISHFKVNKIAAFCSFTKLCSHCHCPTVKHFFISREGSPCPLGCPWALLPPGPDPPICLLSLWIYLLWTFHINRIMLFVAFYVWLLSLDVMFSRFIHMVACVGTPFLFTAKYYSVVWVDHVSTHSAGDGHGGWCHLVDHELCYSEHAWTRAYLTSSISEGLPKRNSIFGINI